MCTNYFLVLLVVLGTWCALAMRTRGNVHQSCHVCGHVFFDEFEVCAQCKVPLSVYYSILCEITLIFFPKLVWRDVCVPGVSPLSMCVCA